MKLSNLLRREKTIATTFQTVTFNAPGTYYPPYGKTTFLLQGQGTPGNAPTGGNYAGTNAATGGNYAGTNAATGGNYAGTNAATGGNYAGTNAATGGNYANTNAGSGGNVAGYSITEYTTQYYAPYGWFDTFSYSYTGSGCPSSFTYNAGGAYGVYESTSYSCSAIYNPYVPGNANYNPVVAGNAYYNPVVAGNAYYNPVVAGNANYNPVVPGNANYNTVVPGNAGPSNSVLGVSLPGGAVATSAPVVGYVPVSIDYTTAGISITCPTGGYVKIQNI